MGDIGSGPYGDGEYEDEEHGRRGRHGYGRHGQHSEHGLHRQSGGKGQREGRGGHQPGLSDPAGPGDRSGPSDRSDLSDHRSPSGTGAAGGLSDTEAERLLNGPWALNARPAEAVEAVNAVDGPGVRNGEQQPKPTDLPELGISAVAGKPARVAYSAGWDGADDPSGHGGARGPAEHSEFPGARRTEAAGGAWQPDRSAGSTDSGGEMSVSSVDFPTDLASPDAQAVARLLAAATAPPGPHELRGYEAARHAFERAGSIPRRGMAVPLRRLIGVKVVAVAGALTVTGVAVAAEADVLPSPIQRVAHQVLGGVGVPEPEPDTTASGPGAVGSSSSSARPGTPRPTGSAAPSTGSGNGVPVPGTPTGTLNPSAPGSSGSTSAADTDALTLCRIYAAQQAGSGDPLTGHDRHRLATLAGGEDKIGDFCARTLAAAPSGASSQPSDPASSSVPSPSKDHKPAGTTSSEEPPSSTSPGNGNGHSHTPSPSHTPHLNKS